MSEERRRILQMLADGKLSVEQAERLLAAVGEASPEPAVAPAGNKPKFLRIVVEPKNGHPHADKVNIKIPVMLIKAGVKLGSMIPKSSQDKLSSELKEKGLDIDLTRLDSESLDALVTALAETSIDIDDEKETVRIFCE